MFLQEKFDYYYEQGQVEAAKSFAIKLLKETPPFSLEKIAELSLLTLKDIQELKKVLESESCSK